MQRNTLKKEFKITSKIDTANSHEVAYWARKWDVSKHTLLEAAQKTGGEIRVIEKQLNLVRM